MAEFRRVKVRAILESDVMLITEDQVDALVDRVCDKLQSTGLILVSVEPQEVASAPAAVPVGYDD